MLKDQKIIPEKPPCNVCSALCCKYFALEIDAPEDWADFENIKWFVAHEDTKVYVEDGDWHLEVQKRCMYLGLDNRCGIYERRPQICRDHGLDEDGDVNCVMGTGELEYELEFHSIEDVEAYIEKNKLFVKERQKRARS